MLIIDTKTLDEKAESLSNSEVYWVYNSLDCCVTYDVLKAIKPQLDEVSTLTYQVSMATAAVAMEMMLEGLLVSEDARSKVIAEFERRQAKLEAGLQRLCVEGLGLAPDRVKRSGGRSSVAINAASPPDVQYLFYGILGIPEKRKKKKGKDEASILSDRATLTSFLSYYHAVPFVNYILALRDCNKALGFLRTKLDPDNKIRCSFNVAGTNTGRSSSSFSDTGTGTNLQNISGSLKDVFVAAPGEMLLDIDLEQGDSRGVAAICWNWFVEEHGEDFAGAYLDACDNGDLHSAVCRMAWGDLDWPEDPKGWKKVAQQIAYRDKSYRDLAKILGHGSNYGGLPATMAGHTKLPVGTVSDFQKRYFSALPVIPMWQKKTIHLLQTERKLITPFGRRRYFWGDVKSSSTHNAAIAYSPQSTTGEFINRGSLQLFHYRNVHDLPIKFLLQVHDSLVLSIKWAQRDKLIPLVLDKLKVILPLARGREFTIPHGIKAGFNYGSFDANKNPDGLKPWVGGDDRRPPKRLTTLEQLLKSQARH